jgi:transposase
LIALALDCEQMPRPDAAAFRAVDGSGGAGVDPQEIRQDARPFDDAALSEAVGVHRAEAFDPCDAARSAKDSAWLEHDYPSIAARAKREKAAIYRSDETGICNQDQIGKGYAPKGRTPILMQTGQKFSTSMIAAVSNRGLMRFKLYKGALNVAIFIDFMKRLVKDAKQKVFLIVDNLRVHHAKAVQDWLARHKDGIDIFYLPAYAPEHNPDEYLNNDLKQTIKNKPRAKTRDDLVAATAAILKSIQKRPGRVKSYFHAKHVRYAA